MKRFVAWCSVLLVVLGISFRVFEAWGFRDVLDSDASTAALMSKHMAEGHEWPVFYYGQAYMGSFEPMVGALICRLLGPSAFSVCLATALLSSLALLAFWRFCVVAGGGRAGVLALAWLVAGPVNAMGYEVCPRGGYAAFLLFEGVLLLGTLVILQRSGSSRRRASMPGWFLLLGVAAGLGWWTTQLITATLVAAGVTLLLRLRMRLFRWDLSMGVVGFLMGSAPFWLWNARHGWETFSFVGSVSHRPPFLVGLHLFFVKRMLLLLGKGSVPDLGLVAIVAILLVGVGVALWVLVNRARRDEDSAMRRRSRDLLVLLVSHLLLSALFFSLSHFSRMRTPRFLLPVIPIAAAGVGIGWSALAGSRRWLLGLLAVVLVSVNGWSVASLLRRCDRGASRRADIVSFEETMVEEKLEGLYVPYWSHYLNFMMDERFCFNSVELERYEPYRGQMDRFRRIGVLKGVHYFADFLRLSGGSAREVKTALGRLHVDLTPPKPVRAAVVPSIGCDDPLAVCYDGEICTFVTFPPNANETDVHVSLGSVASPSMVRLVFSGRDYPKSIEVFGAGPDEHSSLVKRSRLTPYFWSDKRLYHGGSYWRVDIQLDGRPLSKMQFRFAATPMEWKLAEVQFFEGRQEQVAATEADVSALIQSQALERVYCDRWMGHALRRDPALGGICISADPWIEDASHSGALLPVSLAGRTGMVVDRSMLGHILPLLERRGVAPQVHDVGPWRVLTFAHLGADLLARDHYLCWVGFGCLGDRMRERVALRLDKAKGMLAAGDVRGARDTFEACQRLFPTCLPALQGLAACLEAEGLQDAWAAHRATYVPAHPAPVLYREGPELLGVELEKRQVRAGESFEVSWYWSSPGSVDHTALAVFVHIEGAGYTFQDDHVLLSGCQTEGRYGDDDVFICRRIVTIPADAPVGAYALTVGLYRREGNGGRLKPVTALPVVRRGVQMPFRVDVVPGALR